MNKWILIAIIIVLVAGFGLILFRHDLPVWKDIWAYTIVPVAAPYWNMTLNLVRENPIQTLGGMLGGFSALGGLLYKAIGQINVLKTKATEKINEVTSQKDQVTQELYAMEQQFTQEKDTLLTENTDLKSALNDDFYVTITGTLSCMRCYCAWHPNYLEPSSFTKRYLRWQQLAS
jgi:hypothetical protein